MPKTDKDTLRRLLWPARLRTQVILLGGIMLVLTTGALTAYMTVDRIGDDLQTLKMQAQSLTRNLAISTSTPLLTGQYSQIEEMLVLHSSFPGVLNILIASEQGKPLITVAHGIGGDPQIRYGGNTIPLPVTAQPVAEVRNDTMTVWQPVEGGALIGWLKIDFGLKQLRAIQTQTLLDGLIIGVLAIAFSTGLFLLILSRPMRAIAQAAAFARQLNQRRGEAFVPDRSAQELEQLGAALNEASLRLYEQERSLSTANEELRDSEEKFRAVAATANEAIVTADGDGRIIYFNKAAEHIFGYTAAEAAGKTWSLLIPEKNHSVYRNGLRRFLLERSVEVTGKRKDGAEVPLELSLTAWKTAGGRFFTGVMRDISRRKQGEEATRYLADIVESSNDAIVGRGLDGRIISWNAAANQLYGYSAAEIIGQSVQLLVPPDKAAEEQDFLERTRRGEQIVRYETVRVKKDGGLVEIAVTVSPLRDAGGNIVGISTITRDITERKRAEALILELTLTDELTGLHNRRGFFTLAELQLSLDRRLQRGLLLLYTDLDDMKNINDSLGHAEGDRALQDAAGVLRSTFRDSDIIARMGGDEFVVLALRNTPQAPETTIARLQEDLDRFNQRSGRPYALSMSVGAVLLGPDSTQSLEELLSKADAEMYRVKQQRRAGRQH